MIRPSKIIYLIGNKVKKLENKIILIINKLLIPYHDSNRIKMLARNIENSELYHKIVNNIVYLKNNNKMLRFEINGSLNMVRLELGETRPNAVLKILSITPYKNSLEMAKDIQQTKEIFWKAETFYNFIHKADVVKKLKDWCGEDQFLFNRN
jgi:hypothetical protein